MANESDNSFLTSVITAASTTASSLATNLSDRLKDPSPEINPDASSGEEIMQKPRSQTPDPAKPDTAMNVQKRNSGRIHSHTISGDRPPIIITNPRFMPSPQRRNSDGGSPRPPLPTALGDDLQPAAPVAPTTATTEAAAIFSSTAPSLSLEHLVNTSKPISDAGSVHSVASDSALMNEAKTPIADPETPVTKDMLLVPKKRGRARGSSVSTAHSDSKSVSLSRTNSVSSRKATSTRRKDSDDTEGEAGSDVASAATGSIASACGMDLANAKRNSDYHALFRSVPEDDVLIEDYGCALQKEILVQGRMYISETYVCFNANIFGWVTNLVIAFTEIVAIEKRMTAKFIPNAIQISTLHSKHLFASFLSRDQAYDQLVEIWHVAHPNLNGRSLKKIDGLEDENDEEENDSDSYSDETDDSDSEYDSDEYTEVSEDEDEEAEDEGEITEDGKHAPDRQASVHTLPLPAAKETLEQENRRRAVSEVTPRPDAKDLLKPKADGSKPGSSAEDSGVEQTKASAKAVKHAPTECECAKNDEHFSQVGLDETYTGTLETIYNLLYNSGFRKKFLEEKEKSTDVNIGNWEKGSGDIKLAREITYIKYLGGSIGPKSTKCILKEEVLHCDYDDYISQLTTTQTPDVPSGSSFCVKTRTCLTWAGDNKVRMYVTFQVEFSKSSWLKSTIEKASTDGQLAHYKLLDESVRKYIKQHPNEFGGDKNADKGERKKKKKRRRREPKKKDQENADAANHNKGTLHKLISPFLFIGGLLWSGIKFVIEHVQIPTAQHMTMLFMLFMLVLSLLAAQKMADMERQLELLTSQIQGFPSQGVWIGERERDQVWQWLLNKDKDGSTSEHHATPLEASEADRSAWNTATSSNVHNKQDLDHELAQLGIRVQEAQHRLQKMSQE
ncbi:hypothetical protein INT43_005449 [Umbelopsis isabellina]|uniref:VASt domain-containing protein n=1 Tax=Mortierella isabellina TaxID=91625 RepID=A0A8H7PM09_MORIS|nr:hypothetical protein INT43_005449 [Umbelopsis isabellina]